MGNMTAKQFLEQPKLLNEKINMDFMHLQRLRNLRNQFGGGTLQHTKVQGGQLPHSPVTRIIDQIADLEHKIDRELKEYDAIMADVKCAIAACGDFREIQVLTKRYLDEKTWDEINSEMHYSSRHTFELQKEAFRKIELYIAKKSVEKGYNNGAGQED